MTNPIRIFVFLLLFAIPEVYGQDFRFRKLTSNQGLSHNTVYAITQDENGLMWFGTREGLNRFDSYRIKNYYIQNSQLGGSANKINTLLSHQSLIYVGTDNGLYLYNSKKDELQNHPIFNIKTAILSLTENNGNVYIGTISGLFKLSAKKFKRISELAPAKAICSIQEGYFLLAIGNGLKIVNKDGIVQRVFTSSSFPELALSGFIIHSIYRDQKADIWLSTNKGLFNYDANNHRFSKILFAGIETKESLTVRSVLRNSKNVLYIATENGLYTYDLTNGHSQNYQQSFSNDPKKLNDKAVYSIFEAQDGSIWMGTYFGGINYIPASSYGFKSVMSTDKADGLAGKAVSQMMEDNKRRIWIGTEDGGITIYNPSNESYSHINTTSSPFYLTINNVHAIHDDGYGNIWVGTFLGGLHQFNTKTNNTTVFTRKAGDPHSLSNDQVYAIYRDSRRRLWVGTQSGLNIFDYQKKRFYLFMPEIFASKFIYDIVEDKNGDMWFCTRNNGIYRYNSDSKKLVHYSATGKQRSLLSNQIISVYKDSKQQLWFGTLDGGVCRFNIDSGKFKSYTMADGLVNNNVYGILEDDKGIIWLTTNRGISRLDPSTNIFTNYDNKYGLPSNQFNFKSFLKSRSGRLYFGSINGLCYFNSAEVVANVKSFPIVFTDFQLFNKSIVPGESKILTHQINYDSKVELKYSENVFTLHYAALNYANPGSVNYAYYLEGFEEKWNYVGDKNSVTYTNLSPGNYVFHIKAVTPSGEAISLERSLNIHVSPPFYLSGMAFFIYFLLTGLIIYLTARFIKFLHKKKLEIQLERVEKEKIKELTQHRLNFFTFISHEFKTPLTLILASIDKFIEEKGAEFRKSSELLSVKNNASILFKLIQQLMEFRKIETDHAEVHLIHSDLIKFIKKTFFFFEDIAEKKNVELLFSSDRQHLECYFDKDKIEKICLNIMSNAIKNTESGKIEMDLASSDEENLTTISISLTDTGKGMSAKQLKNIFNPFYNGIENRKITAEGSGVGLALVNSLVNYLKGKISINSEPDKGTTVQITLPVLLKLDTSDQFQEEEKVSQLEAFSEEKNQSASENATEDIVKSGKYTLLIVEDNKELQTFLSTHFSKTYKVETASNGVSALRKVHKAPPDIIISDVRMPKMDGLELCEKIKKDEQYAYIPLILLSDSNTENIRINGFDIGADAYISKPFNLKEIELLVSNMIKSRVKLRERIIGTGNFITAKLPRNNKDQEFLIKLSEVLEKHYANPQLTTEEIAGELNMSRTLLHLTLKKLLNKSANQLLNDFRLEKALFMLSNGLSVNEIAYFCGYSDPNYFSRVFKSKFNATPKQYKAENSVKA